MNMKFSSGIRISSPIKLGCVESVLWAFFMISVEQSRTA